MADFALIVNGKRVMSASGDTVMARDGERFLVLREPDGWVEATSTRFRPGEKLPKEVMVWKDRAAAESFAKRWKGHPWWCAPNGTYEVVELSPVTEVVGFKLKATSGVREDGNG